MAKVGSQRTEVRGLADFQRDLRSVDRRWGGELRKALKSVSEPVAESARGRASSSGGTLGKAAPSIKAQAEQRAAKISWGSAREPWAIGAIMGAKQYPQFRPWVGSSWQIGARGQGPYAVNEAIADAEDEIVDGIGDALIELSHEAFPR